MRELRSDLDGIEPVRRAADPTRSRRTPRRRSMNSPRNSGFARSRPPRRAGSLRRRTRSRPVDVRSRCPASSDLVNQATSSFQAAGRAVASRRPLPSAVLATVIVAGVALGNGGGDGGSASDDVVTTGELTQLTVPDSVPDVIATVETTAPITKSILERTLSKGVAGADVQAGPATPDRPRVRPRADRRDLRRRDDQGGLGLREAGARTSRAIARPAR